MNREKYETLPLTTLKELAKARGLKGISTLKKSDLIEEMLKADERDSAKEAKEEVKPAPETKAEEPKSEEKPAEAPAAQPATEPQQ